MRQIHTLGLVLDGFNPDDFNGKARIIRSSIL